MALTDMEPSAVGRVAKASDRAELLYAGKLDLLVYLNHGMGRFMDFPSSILDTRRRPAHVANTPFVQCANSTQNSQNLLWRDVGRAEHRLA